MGLFDLLDSQPPTPSDHDDEGMRIPVITHAKWKDTEDPTITFWLHPSITELGKRQRLHRAVTYFPAYATNEDGTEFLRPGHRFMSPDSISACLAQKRLGVNHDYRRWHTVKKGSDTMREYATVVWPVLKLYHYLLDGIAAGEIDPDALVFRWVYTDRDGVERVIEKRAGGMVGASSDPEAWKQSIKPRYESVVPVVQNDDRDTGPQLLITTGMLAGAREDSKRPPYMDFDAGLIGSLLVTKRRSLEKTNDQRAKMGKPTVPLSTLDPIEHPYPFVLTYDDNAKAPGDRYKITDLADAVNEGLYEVDDALQRAFDTEITFDMIAPFHECRESDCELLYDSMRRGNEGCDIELPLDELFADWRAQIGSDTVSGSGSNQSKPSTSNKGGKTRSNGSKSPKIAEPEVVFCDCGLELDPKWAFCAHCGAEKGGSEEPPDLTELSFNGGRQKCSCGEVCALDAGTCPACNAELPIDLLDDDDLDGDYLDNDQD